MATRQLPITNSIRRLRFDAQEMTQQSLAQRVGVTRQTIIAIESCKYSPSLEVAFRIAEAFNVALDEVFEYQPQTSEKASAGASEKTPQRASE